MAIFTILALKNRITERIHGNRARVITGVDLQEILHDIIDSLIGSGGEVVPGTGPTSQISDYGLTGAVNGVNTLFATSHNYIDLSTHVYLNGVRLFRGEDYTEQGDNQISFTTAPFLGDKIIVDYFYLTT
ncbi:MAG: hypothetical protein WC865_08965 [Bacteroidales bacterium]